jgi:hypothetical protein
MGYRRSQLTPAQHRQLLLEVLDGLEVSDSRKQWMFHMLAQAQSTRELQELISEFNRSQLKDGKALLVQDLRPPSTLRLL